MIKKILIAFSILAFIFTTVCAVSAGEKKDQQETYNTEYHNEKFTVYKGFLACPFFSFFTSLLTWPHFSLHNKEDLLMQMLEEPKPR